MGAMLVSIGVPLHERSRLKTRLQLLGQEMHRRRWEIGQPTGVIQVHVRQKDVPHICWIVASGFNLLDCSLVRIKSAPDKGCEMSHDWRWVGAIAHSPTRIHQGQSIAGFHEQGMDHPMPALEKAPRIVISGKPKGVHRSAVEMVDPHGILPYPRTVRSYQSLFPCRTHYFRLI
jgi:hypothetical protein